MRKLVVEEAMGEANVVDKAMFIETNFIQAWVEFLPNQTTRDSGQNITGI